MFITHGLQVEGLSVRLGMLECAKNWKPIVTHLLQHKYLTFCLQSLQRRYLRYMVRVVILCIYMPIKQPRHISSLGLTSFMLGHGSRMPLDILKTLGELSLCV